MCLRMSVEFPVWSTNAKKRKRSRAFKANDLCTFLVARSRPHFQLNEIEPKIGKENDGRYNNQAEN